MEALKIELGGGSSPKEGFVNLDIVPSADIQIDLMSICRGESLPFDSNSVSHIYSAHFWEHIDCYQNLLHELARVCKVGGVMTMIVPHWGQPMAVCGGHRHVMSEDVVNQWEDFKDVWWGKHPKMFQLVKTNYTPSFRFKEAKALFPNFTDVQLFTYVPATCHEIIFEFSCVENFKML